MLIGEDLAILVQELDANVSHLETITHQLSPEQFNWRPASGEWSIGQCIGHLNIINAADVAPIEDGRARGISGEGPFTYGSLSRKFISMSDLPVKKRQKTIKAFYPPVTHDRAKTIAEYRRVSAELRRLALSANEFDLARVKTVMPPCRRSCAGSFACPWARV